MTELPTNILKYLCLIVFFKPYTEDQMGFFNYLNNIVYLKNPVPIRNIEHFFDFREKCFSKVFMDLPLEQHRIYFKHMYPYLKNRLLYVNVRVYLINDAVKYQVASLLEKLGIPTQIKPRCLYISKEHKRKFVDLMLNPL